jgi:hypothetical protein
VTAERTDGAAESGFTPFVIQPGQCDPVADDEIVFFPEYMDGEIAVYRSAVIPLVKRLRAGGINARYAFPPERRTWLREYSAGEVLGAVAIGIGTGAPWFVLGQILAKRNAGIVKLKTTRARKVKGRRMWDAEFVELSGSAGDVAEAMRRFAEDGADE